MRSSYHTLTYIIFVIAVVATLPQLYQTFRTQQTGDFSVLNLVLNDFTNILLAIYGYLIGDTGIFLLGAWFTIYWSILLSMKLRFI